VTGLLSDVPGGTLDSERGGIGYLFLLVQSRGKKKHSAFGSQQSERKPNPKDLTTSCAQKNKGPPDDSQGRLYPATRTARVSGAPGCATRGSSEPTPT